ncbi:MAG: TIGR03905 family TSCPD domain-containing protein [Muribaculaceae bacterium]|nr:TIGR03905 family TSCPD domain-containing protein [Muribaculaceae bacterium]
MHHEYAPQGTCSRLIEFDLDDENRIHNVRFTGGCHGNLQGIGALVEGCDASEVVKRLRGIRCGNKPTSCPDRLASALSEAMAQAVR